MEGLLEGLLEVRLQAMRLALRVMRLCPCELPREWGRMNCGAGGHGGYCQPLTPLGT